MTQILINVGATANDGTGDPLRTAYTTCNSNFTDLYGKLSANTTSNVAVGNLTVGSSTGGLLAINAPSSGNSLSLYASQVTEASIVGFYSRSGLINYGKISMSNTESRITATSTSPLTLFTNTSSERMRIDSNGNVGIGNSSPLHTFAVTGSVYFGNAISIKAILEAAVLTAAAPSATTNFDISTQAVQYYTTNAANNFTFNARGNASTSLDTVLAVGRSVTIALLVTNGGTAYYPTAFQVDGNAVTPKWQNGIAPVAGNINSVDVYNFVIIKTAAATFTMLGSQTQFA